MSPTLSVQKLSNYTFPDLRSSWALKLLAWCYLQNSFYTFCLICPKEVFTLMVAISWLSDLSGVFILWIISGQFIIPWFNPRHSPTILTKQSKWIISLNRHSTAHNSHVSSYYSNWIHFLNLDPIYLWKPMLCGASRMNSKEMKAGLYFSIVIYIALESSYFLSEHAVSSNCPCIPAPKVN